MLRKWRPHVTSQLADINNELTILKLSHTGTASYAAITANNLERSEIILLVHQESLERKSSLVVFGIDECPDKTPRYKRTYEDTDQVVNVLSSVCGDIAPHLIRDCFRLGKFQKDRHCPILVKMNRVCDISKVLANRSKLADSPGISVKNPFYLKSEGG